MQAITNYKKIISVFCFMCFGMVFAGNLPTIYLLHINGIDTSYQEAYNNLIALRANSPNQNTPNTDMTEWDLVYNPTK